MIAAALLLSSVLAGEVDAAAVHRLVAAQKGHPVLLNLWATWCAPCLAEFPELIRLAHDRPDLVIVSVSIDDASERAAAEKVVLKQKPPFPVYWKKPGEDEAFINGVDRRWSGSLPAVLIFDVDGRQTALLEGEHSRAELERAIDGKPPTRR